VVTEEQGAERWATKRRVCMPAQRKRSTDEFTTLNPHGDSSTSPSPSSSSFSCFPRSCSCSGSCTAGRLCSRSLAFQFFAPAHNPSLPPGSQSTGRPARARGHCTPQEVAVLKAMETCPTGSSRGQKTKK